MTSTYQHSSNVRNIARHLIAVICPPDAAELGVVEDIADHLQGMMAATPAVIRAGMIAGMLTYDVGALAAAPLRGKRAQTLTGETAAAYFDTWAHGPTILHRQLAKALVQLITLAYYEQPAVQRRLGYTPAAWIEKVTKRRLTMYQDDIAVGQRRIIAADPLRPGINIKQQRAVAGS